MNPKEANALINGILAEMGLNPTLNASNPEYRDMIALIEKENLAYHWTVLAIRSVILKHQRDRPSEHNPFAPVLFPEFFQQFHHFVEAGQPIDPSLLSNHQSPPKYSNS